ncbi:MAG: indole-3-glycerol phosphate synthase TrpC [Alphaproteobacteria bacterium]
MSDTLRRILDDKRALVARRRAERSIEDLRREAIGMEPPRGFAAALRAGAASGFGLIAEIKKASPSKGLIRADFDPPSLARAYRAGGANCLSVLTDEPYFRGCDDFLIAARAAVDLPALRKDFMIDPWQITESRAIGADCILLIMAAVDDTLAAEIEAAAFELGMDVLIEVHDEAELDRALHLRSPLLGVNNRNLRTLAVDLATTERLAPRVGRDRLLVCESGIRTHADLERMARVGARCFLVGEHLMSQPDVASATRVLLGTAPAEAG